MAEAGSSVWKFFKKENDNASVCQVCMRAVKNKGGNTSNLSMHLRRNHVKEYASINPKRTKTDSPASKKSGVGTETPVSSQPTIHSAFYRTAPFQPSNPRQQAITDAITHFLCKDNVAFNAVSRPGFQHLLNVLEF